MQQLVLSRPVRPCSCARPRRVVNRCPSVQRDRQDPKTVYAFRLYLYYIYQFRFRRRPSASLEQDRDHLGGTRS